MKRLLYISILIFTVLVSKSQVSVNGNKITLQETYITAHVEPSQLQALSDRFSVDKVTRVGSGLEVQICLQESDIDDFLSMDIPYSVCENTRAYVQMAHSYDEMVASWNRYPTYSAYCQIMERFQSEHPELCSIDTILASTPNGHSIFVAHISSNVVGGGKPSVLYTSTIHGDEVVGYYMLIRLIDKLLNEYSTNEEIKGLVDNTDIWICPLHNPDGTYRTSDNTINSSPVSTRANAHNIDLNRSFPKVTGPVAKSDYEPEVEAMMEFMETHNFTLAANLHGGAEVFNFPWDSWMTYQRKHADFDWWNLVGRAFADTCHKYSQNYMLIEDNGVTPGGDWYVITGSMQDYHNYYLGTRHVTIEVGDDKVLSSYLLPTYWGYAYRSLLNFIGESVNGIHGVVTDTLTGEPLKATVFINSHDKDHSHVESSLPYGDYHRPIKAGTYAVTFSSPGYLSKTVEVSAEDGAKTVLDVQLVKNTGIVGRTQGITVYPNPANDYIYIGNDGTDVKSTARFYDQTGRLLQEKGIESSTNIDISTFPAGVYLLEIENRNGVERLKIIKR